MKTIKYSFLIMIFWKVTFKQSYTTVRPSSELINEQPIGKWLHEKNDKNAALSAKELNYVILV